MNNQDMDNESIGIDKISGDSTLDTAKWVLYRRSDDNDPDTTEFWDGARWAKNKGEAKVYDGFDPALEALLAHRSKD